MFVNADTLASLQILQFEFHPNSHMQGPTNSASGAKESLSVFGLFHKLARTPQGKHRLRQMFLRPSTDIDIINERHNTLKVLSDPHNADAYQAIVKSLKQVKNIRTVVVHLKKGITIQPRKQPGIFSPSKRSAIRSGVWGSLFQFAENALALQAAVRILRNGDKISIVSKVRIVKLHPILYSC